MYEQILKNRKKLILLFVIGFAVAVFLKANLSRSSSMFLSDMFFMVSAIYLFCGFFGLVNNMGVFNSFKFGTKSLYKIFKSDLGSSAEVKEDYFIYINSRPKTADVPVLLVFGASFCLVSVLCSFISL